MKPNKEEIDWLVQQKFAQDAVIDYRLKTRREHFDTPLTTAITLQLLNLILRKTIANKKYNIPDQVEIEWLSAQTDLPSHPFIIANPRWTPIPWATLVARMLERSKQPMTPTTPAIRHFKQGDLMSSWNNKDWRLPGQGNLPKFGFDGYIPWTSWIETEVGMEWVKARQAQIESYRIV